MQKKICLRAEGRCARTSGYNCDLAILTQVLLKGNISRTFKKKVNGVQRFAKAKQEDHLIQVFFMLLIKHGPKH